MPEPSLVIESWVEYGFGVLAILLRVVSRILIRRTRWQGDDFLILLVLLFYTITTLCIWKASILGTSTTRESNTAAEADDLLRTKLASGSKWDYTGFWFYTATIWTLKVCQLYYYHRLNSGLRQHILVVRLCAAVVGISYMAVLITLLAQCHPFRLNFELKTQKADRCTYKMEIFLVIGIANVISNLCLFVIPISLLRKANIPHRNKVQVAALLCGGVFVILASLFRTAFSVKAAHFALRSTRADMPSGYSNIVWASREMLVAILVVNAPLMATICPRFGTLDSLVQPPDPETSDSEKEDPRDETLPIPTPVQPVPSEMDIERQPSDPKSTPSGNVIAASPDWSFITKSDDDLAGQEYIMPLAPPSATHRGSTVTADSSSICDTLFLPPPGIRLLDKGARLG